MHARSILHRIIPRTLGLALAVLLPLPASAQAIIVRGELADARSDYMGSLAGASVLGVFPLGTSRVHVQVGVERLAGSSNPTASACGGLIAPGGFSCAPELLALDAHATGALAGLRVRVGPQWRGALYLGGNLGFSRLTSRGAGVQSGVGFDLGQTMLRSDVFIEAELVPWRGRGWGFVLGQSIGAYSPSSVEVIVDGFTPLDDGMRVWRGWVGVSWRRETSTAGARSGLRLTRD